MSFNRTKSATRTFVFGVVNKIITILFPFVTRTIIIYKLGAEYLGITSLFTSVLQILNVSELGISSAISFCLYKPIAEDDKDTINALIGLMRKLYKFIGAFILITGIMLLPFLNYLIIGNYPPDMNISVLYILYLLNSAVSYLGFAYKGMVFEAFQQGDINHKILSVVEIVKYIVQIVILLFYANYYWFAAMLPLGTVAVTIITEIISKKKHPNIIPRGEVSKETKNIIRQKIFFLSAHSIAATLTNSIDNIVISGSMGLIATAIYGNYFYIYSSVTSILVIAYRAIKPAIGNSVYTDRCEKKTDIIYAVQFLCAWIIMWCATCLLCLYQPFMEIWVGEKYLLQISTVIIIVLYFYGNALKLLYSNIFIGIAGLWNKTLIRQIAVAIINLVLDILLVRKFKIAGIVFASFFATTIVALPLDVSVSYKYVFSLPVKYGLLKLVRQLVASVLICAFTYFICISIPVTGIIRLAIRMLICLTLPNIIMIITCRNQKEYIYIKEHILSLK